MKKRKVTLFTAGILCAASMVTGVVATSVAQKISAELRPDFTIKIDGKVTEFKNAQGETVYPILYDGTTYLPVRAIGQMMGKTVYWNESEKLIELKETTVTDADVFVDTTSGTTNQGNDRVNPSGKHEEKPAKPKDDKNKYENNGEGNNHRTDVDTSKFIGEEKAKEIALKRAGISADGVMFEKVKLDYDDGVWEYEVEFKKGTMEYDADIKAEDGTILSWNSEVDYD